MTLKVNIQHDWPGIAFDVNFEAPSGLTVLFGRSGSGKTTVVNAIAGLENPSVGYVAVDDWVLMDTARRFQLSAHKRRLGYIFQEARLFPHLTVRQNLLYGKRFAPANAQTESYDKIVDMLGIGHLLTRRPALLSGGEKQRVAIGRAMLACPKLILADEPLAALDDARKSEILSYFERLRDEFSIPILYVTHSVSEVARLATTVVALENGKVARCGPAVDVLSDPSFTLAGVRAVGALIEAKVSAHHDDGLTELDAGGAALLLPRISHSVGKSVRVRIAAHEVLLSLQKPVGISALNAISGTIEDIRSGGGPGAIVSIQTQAGRILSRVTQRSVNALALMQGVPVFAIIKSVSVAPENIGGTIDSVK